MRSIALFAAILLLGAVAPATMAADDGEDLRERNLEYMLEELGHEIPEEATATVLTADGERTVPATEAIDGALDNLDAANIDLAALDEASEEQGLLTVPAAAGQESFPLVGTQGSIVEVSIGSGLLPAECEEAVTFHEVSEETLNALDPVFTQPTDGLVTSTLSESVPTSQATMTDDAGALDDTVTGYASAILAAPNYDASCTQFEFCFFGFCSHFIQFSATLATGAVVDGDVAQLIHDEEPIPDEE